MQTCIVACSSLAFAGGFGCYLLSMDEQTFLNVGNIAGNRPEVIVLACFPQDARLPWIWHRWHNVKKLLE